MSWTKNNFWLLRLLPAFFLLTVACFPEPNYPNEPAISFLSIRNKPFQGFDSVYVTIRFEDGDGNLGLRNNEVEPPYAPTTLDENGNQVPNKFFNNIFMGVLRSNGGEFQPIVFPGNASFDGRFPRLRSGDSTSPLEGEITYAIELFIGVLGSPINRGDQIVFELQIADRALNLSNTVRSTPITAGVASD